MYVHERPNGASADGYVIHCSAAPQPDMIAAIDCGVSQRRYATYTPGVVRARCDVTRCNLESLVLAWASGATPMKFETHSISTIIMLTTTLLSVSCLLDGTDDAFTGDVEPRAGSTLFFDDFNDGWAGWSTTGNVTQDNSPALVPNSARLRQDATLSRSVSTVGSTGISITWNMAATSLESGDYCHLEVDEGLGYSIIATLGNGDDNGVFHNGTVVLGAGADDNPALGIRFRAAGGNTGRLLLRRGHHGEGRRRRWEETARP